MRISFARTFLVLIYLGLSPFNFVQAKSNEDLATLIAWLEGGYSNQAQVDAGVLDADSNLLFPVFRQVDIPVFGGHVIYLQWHIGSPKGPLQRQRIWSFAEDQQTGALSMAFFTLKEPDKWFNAHLEPYMVRNMTRDDVIGYPDACLLPVVREGERFVARIPTTCLIVSQSTKTSMTLQSETTIGPNQMTYQEAGVREDGALVFQVPPTGRYVFGRVAD